MKKMYLNDLMLEKKLEIKRGKLNLVIAPCGSGKTTWFFKTLAKKYKEMHRIIYLVDTNMLEESMLDEHKDILSVYDPNLKDDLTVLDRIGSCKNKITVMSYCKFGLLMKKRSDLLKYIDLVLIDEAHNLVNYSQMNNLKLKELADIGTEDRDINDATKYISNTARTLYMLPEILETCNVVLTTATPKKILEYEYLDQKLIYDVLGEHKKLLKSYKNEVETNFIHIKNLYKNFKKIDKYATKKILIYTKHITTCKEIAEEFTKMGYNTRALWSLKNAEHKMTDEQIELRDHLIKENKYPDNLDVLIVNAAYMTGWNLKDERVQIVICNTEEVDSIIQSRSRCRHNIEHLYTNATDIRVTEEIKLSDKYLDVKLSTEDKDELCYDLDIRNEKGRIKKWTSISKELEKNGYKITEERTNKKRFHIITKLEDANTITNYIADLLEIKLTKKHIIKLNSFMAEQNEYTVKYAIEDAYKITKHYNMQFENDEHKFNTIIIIAQKEDIVDNAKLESSVRASYIKQQLNKFKFLDFEVATNSAEYTQKTKEVNKVSRIAGLW